MLNGLGGVRDSWTLLGNSVESGHTVVSDTNFHEDADDRPARSERLDYVLLRAGHRAIPIVSSIEVLRIQRNGRFISDHFGVFATFDRVALVSG
jgi:endonuclease/exonuclease/phosphatase family metal-dependent hydrolase